MSDLAALPVNLPRFEGVPAEKVPHVLSCLNATLATFSKHERILGRGEAQRSTGYLCEGRAQLVSNDYWATAPSWANTPPARYSQPSSSSS